MPRVQSEYEVESLFIDDLQSLGYDYVSMKNYDDVLANFRTQLCKLNSAKLNAVKGEAVLSDKEFSRVMQHLDGHTVYESAKILRDQYVLELDSGRTVYLDFLTDDEARNIYQVTHQVTMDPKHKNDVLYKNRYDVTILINGLPLVQIELKRPGVEINEAVNQINRYRRFSFKGLFRFIQIFIVSNSVQTKYCANCNEIGPDGNVQNILKSLVFYWTDVDNKRKNRLSEFTFDFLRKATLTEMLTKYFVVKESGTVLMVMRPYQVYAVKLAYDRIIGSALNGYVFHTTGSGKTLTSFKLATLLRDNRNIDRVFFLIDRKDLDDQTVDEYNSFEAGCVDNTDSTKMLVADLQDSTKTMIVTTIQKMATALRKPQYAKVIDEVKKKRCVFIIDECHRSQFGKMHSDITKAFKKANFVGFTGTPIFKENANGGRTTADLFKAGKVRPCIHKYMIKEAIADGNVLRFSVEYNRFIDLGSVTDPSIDPEKLDDPDYCRKNNIDLASIYHDERRMKVVADDILKNLEQHTHPQGKDVYTAIFAADSIQNLMWYYHYMRKHNKKGYRIAAIFTYQANADSDEGVDENASSYLKECMDDYNTMFGTHYDLDTFDGYRRNISKRMKQMEEPQVDLLLVVRMFLTGFDSKPTNTLLLDRNLVWHNLLQAYSRTNRVDKLTKQYGQIVTYRNIKKAQDEALKLYSGDNDPNDFILETYEVYLSHYDDYVRTLRDICPTADDAGYLYDENEQRKFILAFRNVARTLAILKTYSKFEWDDLAVFLDEDEYFAYKSWYLTFFDNAKEGSKKGQESTLIDIDFEIELVRTDKINVVYILNLLKEINRADPQKMQESIDLILREIERSDNEKLRYKKDIMTAFVTERFFSIDPDMDITQAYEEYEKEVLQKRVSDFAQENDVDEQIISELLSKYLMDDKSLSKEDIRKAYKPLNLGLLALTKLINKTIFFIRETGDAFSAEGI